MSSPPSGAIYVFALRRFRRGCGLVGILHLRQPNFHIMNYCISILFRVIPLLMAAFCFAYGAYVLTAGDSPDRLIAGYVIFFLGSVCVALYCTAVMLIRHIVGTCNTAAKYIFPILGYAFALFTLVYGLTIIDVHYAPTYVSGHVVCGLALITACVATAAASSTGFGLIPVNSADSDRTFNPSGFSRTAGGMLMGVVAVVSTVAWIWAIILLAMGNTQAHFVAGCIMAGIACVCMSLIALVASIVRQVQGIYTDREKVIWPLWTLMSGLASFVLGLVIVLVHWGGSADFVGFVLIGLALVCWSVSGAVILLAKTWHSESAPVSRIPLIPVIATLTSLFMAAFLFEEALFKIEFFVPARVLVGFGAICFAIFSIVSIIENGAKKK